MNIKKIIETYLIEQGYDGMVCDDRIGHRCNCSVGYIGYNCSDACDIDKCQPGYKLTVPESNGGTRCIRIGVEKNYVPYIPWRKFDPKNSNLVELHSFKCKFVEKEITPESWDGTLIHRVMLKTRSGKIFDNDIVKNHMDDPWIVMGWTTEDIAYFCQFTEIDHQIKNKKASYYNDSVYPDDCYIDSLSEE